MQTLISIYGNDWFDFQDIPIVVVGNKVDTIREIEPEDINDWVETDLPKERYENESVD